MVIDDNINIKSRVLWNLQEQYYLLMYMHPLLFILTISRTKLIVENYHVDWRYIATSTHAPGWVGF